jgi:hypothetical protein
MEMSNTKMKIFCDNCDEIRCGNCSLLKNHEDEREVKPGICRICERNPVKPGRDCCDECGFDQYHSDSWEQMGYPTEEEYNNTK